MQRRLPRDVRDGLPALLHRNRVCLLHALRLTTAGFEGWSAAGVRTALWRAREAAVWAWLMGPFIEGVQKGTPPPKQVAMARAMPTSRMRGRAVVPRTSTWAPDPSMNTPAPVLDA